MNDRKAGAAECSSNHTKWGQGSRGKILSGLVIGFQGQPTTIGGQPELLWPYQGVDRPHGWVAVFTQEPSTPSFCHAPPPSESVDKLEKKKLCLPRSSYHDLKLDYFSRITTESTGSCYKSQIHPDHHASCCQPE